MWLVTQICKWPCPMIVVEIVMLSLSKREFIMGTSQLMGIWRGRKSVAGIRVRASLFQRSGFGPQKTDSQVLRMLIRVYLLLDYILQSDET